MNICQSNQKMIHGAINKQKQNQLKWPLEMDGRGKVLENDYLPCYYNPGPKEIVTFINYN